MKSSFNLLLAHWELYGRSPSGPRLPEEYQEVEYIYTTAKTYLDTGLKAASTDIYECVAAKTAESTNQPFIGDGNTKTDSNFAVWLSDLSGQTYWAEASFGNGNTASYKVEYSKSGHSSFSLTSLHTYKMDLTNGKFYLDGDLVGTATSRSTFANTKKLVIFGSWRGTSSNDGFVGKMGECVFWRNGVEIRRFVPCYRKSDNQAGFYDLCESSSPSTSSPFYVTANASYLNAGPDVTTEITTVYYSAAEQVTLYSSDGVKSHTFSNGLGTVVLNGIVTEMPQTLRSTAITDVMLPVGMTSIGVYAFYGCTNLVNATLPASIKTLRHNSFSGCMSLALTSLPAGITSIEYSTFDSCTNLALTSLPAGITQIGSTTFLACKHLAFTSLPEGVTTIGDSAFYNSNVALTSLPSSVTEIGQFAFTNCSNLALTSLPPGITTINYWAFRNCTSLALTSLPSGVTSIGEEAFYGCTNLALTSLPENLTTISRSAFYDCANITVAFIPDSVTEIWQYAFNGCSKLAITTLPRNLALQGSGIFARCSSITTLDLPDLVYSLITFDSCLGLTTVYFEEMVSNITYSTFGNCTNLLDIYVPWSEGEVVGAPWGATNATVHYRGNIPANDEIWYYANSQITLYDSTGVANHTFSNGKGVVEFSSNVTTVQNWFRGNTEIKKIMLPDSVTTIGDYSFYGCTSLTWVGMPDEIVSIGGHAFQGCSALSLRKMPEDVTTLGIEAFRGCSALAIASLPSGLTTISEGCFRDGYLSIKSLPDELTSIGEYAFYNCTGMSVSEIPSGVTEIPDYAFYGCPLISSMTLHEDITSVGDSAFENCGKLVTIVFLGTPTDISATAFQSTLMFVDIYVPWLSTDAINVNAPWGSANGVVHYALPSGYKRVDYLNSTGEQYINTGANATSQTAYSINCRFYEKFDGNSQTMCGTRGTNDSDGNTNQRLVIYRYTDSKGDRIILQRGEFSTTPHLTADTNFHNYYSSAEKRYIDNYLYDSHSVTSANTPMYLFAQNFSTMLMAKADIKRFVMWDGNTMVRDMVPCVRLSDNKPGMYDTQGSTCSLTGTPFYINSGSGRDFIAGEYAAVPSLWLEADSWGSSTWANKGDDSYTVSVVENKCGTVSGNAIVCTKAAPVCLQIADNVVGTSSFTIEFVGITDPSVLGSGGAARICCQRQTSDTPNGAFQFYMGQDGNVYLDGWDSNGTNILGGDTGLSWTGGVIQYVAVSYKYPYISQRITKVDGNQKMYSTSNMYFSAAVSTFTVGYNPWAAVGSSYRRYFLGSIYSLRVHRRNLTEAELEYNYNVDRKRFNF